MPGNDIDVNFVLDYKVLHDAGYNVLAYDLRNFGHSGSANGGVLSGGVYEGRDVIGSIDYVRGREDTKDMTIGLLSRCNSANATMSAMARRPEVFEGIRCMVAPQPLSVKPLFERTLESMNLPMTYLEDMDRMLRTTSSRGFDDMSPIPWAKAVK